MQTFIVILLVIGLLYVLWSVRNWFLIKLDELKKYIQEDM